MRAVSEQADVASPPAAPNEDERRFAVAHDPGTASQYAVRP